jgi:hypothetical protein
MTTKIFKFETTDEDGHISAESHAFITLDDFKDSKEIRVAMFSTLYESSLPIGQLIVTEVK